MDILIGMITANMSLSLLSTLGSAINTCYSVSEKMSTTKSDSLTAIQQLIEEQDLKNVLTVIKEHISKVKPTKNHLSSLNTLLCGITATIEKITDEQKKIQYRIEYNKGSYFFKYRFENCYKRLSKQIKILKVRYRILLKILNIAGD